MLGLRGGLDRRFESTIARMLQRWRGLKGLIHDAVDRTTELVDEGHESTSRTVLRVFDAVPPLAEPARAVDGVRRVTTRGVLGTIRVVNRLVEAVTDVGLDVAERVVEPPAVDAVPMRSDVMRTARWVGDAALGLVNGAIGDHLSARANGLDLGMSIRYRDAYLELDRESLTIEDATPKIAVFVHGLGTTEWSWCLESEAYHGEPGASFGTLLARDLGYTPLYVRYNTGRHVSENGRRLAQELARLVERYPVPIEELLLVGHSMGGLVVRSACHYAAEEGLAWITHVRRVACLGSPHHGAPLEKLGNLAAAVLDSIDTPGTRIPARLIQGRSAGIKDLRRGALVDEDWLGQDPDALRAPDARSIPLLEHVRYAFLSASVTTDPEHPLGRILGDLLVQVPSASGSLVEHRTFPIETACHGGVLHHQLQNHPAVYAQLRALCTEP
jgi:pimeloyl-ACP methyl ester carboxylesterase